MDVTYAQTFEVTPRHAAELLVTTNCCPCLQENLNCGKDSSSV